MNNSEFDRKANAVVNRMYGKLLRDCRMQCRMTKKTIAKLMGVTVERYMRWERGDDPMLITDFVKALNLMGFAVMPELYVIEVVELFPGMFSASDN